MKTQLEKIAGEVNRPCVTISLNTHRTYPDNASDAIVLKNLLLEATESVVAEFGKRPVTKLLDRINTLSDHIDNKDNLDSLHLFLSNSTTAIVQSPWSVTANSVHIADRFFIKPLIRLLNQTEHYLILILSQSGGSLLHAINNGIVAEIKNDDFPIGENQHYITNHEEMSDGKKVDNMVREYLNTVDKAVVRVNHDTNMRCVVVCTEDNYSRLLQVADVPSIYYGHVPVDYNDISHGNIIPKAWAVVEQIQQQRRTDAIKEMQEAVGQGLVITDLNEMYRAAKEGRGELLITHNDFQQPVKMTGPISFDVVADATQPNVIADISSEIAWEVISKKGRAIFTSQPAIKTLGNIVLKVRY